jgi:hypothetical protein
MVARSEGTDAVRRPDDPFVGENNSVGWEIGDEIGGLNSFKLD